MFRWMDFPGEKGNKLKKVLVTLPQSGAITLFLFLFLVYAHMTSLIEKNYYLFSKAAPLNSLPTK